MALDQPQLIALKAELDTDPEGLGYSTPPDTQGVADLLNTPGLSGETINNTTVSVDDIWLAIDWDELPNIHVNKMLSFLDFVRDKGVLDISQGSGTKALVAKVFTVSDTPISRGVLDNLKDRPASRGEKLFGINIIITHTDVGRARQVV